MRLRLSLVLPTLLLFTLTAHADTKSWKAVKAKIPTGTQIVLGFDVAQIAKSSVYTQLIQAAFTEERDLKEAHDAIKGMCGIDVTTAITDVTVVGAAEPEDKALIAIGVTGVDKTKFDACLKQIAAKEANGAQLTIKTKGKVTEYGLAGNSEKFYVAWLAKDVIALTDEPDQKGRLEKMMAGKAAKGELKARLARTKPTSPMFAAVAIKEKVSEINGTIKGGYGGVELSAGSIVATAQVVMSTAEEATKLADLIKAQLGEMQREVGKQMPDLAKIIAATQVSATDVEVTISASITEKLVVSLLPMLDKIF